jgi:hypothetical protein
MRDPRTGLVIATHKARNTVTDNFKVAIANAIAQQASGFPDYIALGTGASTTWSYDPSHVTSNASLGASGQAQLAEGLVGTMSGNKLTFLLWLRRVGSSSGTLTIEIQGGTTSPNGTATYVSDPVSINSLDTVYSWIRFSIDDVPAYATGKYIVLKSTGYTYAAGVTEVQWGYDGSGASVYSPANSFMKFNGTTWSAFGTPAGDAAFRLAFGLDDSSTTLIGEQSRKQISSRSKPQGIQVRFLSIFGTADANEYITQAGMFDAASGGNLLAVANVYYLKTNTLVVDSFWTTTVQGA